MTQAWVYVNTVYKISTTYVGWNVWIEDVYGELHGFKVVDSTRYCDQDHPTVLLDVVGQVDQVNCMRWKLIVPPTLDHGVTEIIVHNHQVKAVVITSKTAVATYGQDSDTGTKWVSIDKNFSDWSL